MKKIIGLTVMSFMLMLTMAFGQIQQQTTIPKIVAQPTLSTKIISTDLGSLTVLKNSMSQDYFQVDQITWDNYAAGTGFTTPQIGNNDIHIRIVLATRKSGCKSGLGFRCPAQVTVTTTNQVSFTPRPTDRTFDAILKNVNGKIQMTFLGSMDWNWLNN